MLIFLLQCFLTGVVSLPDGNQSVHSGILFSPSEIQARLSILKIIFKLIVRA